MERAHPLIALRDRLFVIGASSLLAGAVFGLDVALVLFGGFGALALFVWTKESQGARDDPDR